MTATNSKALSVNPWIIEVASYSSSITTLADDMTNADTVRSELDALSYERLASIIDLQVSENYWANVVKIEADDNWVIYSSTKPEMTISWTRYEVLELDAINKLTGKNILQVAWWTVNVTWEALWTGWTVWQPIKLLNKNGADTIVTNIVIDADTVALVSWTDYATYVGNWVNGELGYTYIVPITAQAWVLDADYDYVPTASSYIGVNVKSREIPRLVVRITSIDSATSKVKVYYFIDCWFEWELITWFLDVNRASDLPNSPLNILCNNNWSVIYYTDDL